MLKTRPTAPYAVCTSNMSYWEGEPCDNVPLAHKLWKPLVWERGFAKC